MQPLIQEGLLFAHEWYTLLLKVKGLVAQLIKVKDVKYATSLEVAAGGKVRMISNVSDVLNNS